MAEDPDDFDAIVGPPPFISIGGVQQWLRWKCPAGCGYMILDPDPHARAGIVAARADAHVCKERT